MAGDHFDFAMKSWGWRPRTPWAAEMMSEAFTVMKGKMGDLKVTTAAMTDPHIQELISMAAEQLNVPPAEIEKRIGAEINKVEEMKKYSYILYDTCSRKIVRDSAFDLVEHAAKSPRFKRVPFNEDEFDDLLNKIRFEHKGFFPLKRPDRYMPINHISPIIVPGSSNPAHKKYDGIGTACATDNGDFVFNRPFMQKLMDYAVIEGAKGKGKKYQSQGGPIPDAYAFIETLILHELLHYKYGDHEKLVKFPQYAHTVHNYAMDFRINHLLSKAGYPQIPSLLLSDHINLDQQGSYVDMMRLVRDELAKLPKPLKDVADDLLKTDEHPNQPKQPKQPKQPNQPKQPKQPNQPYQAKQGDVVRLPDGSYGKVSRIDPDGSFDVDPMSKEEASRALKYPSGKTVKEGSGSFAVLHEGKYKPEDVTWMKPYQAGGGGDGGGDPGMEGEDPPSEPGDEGPGEPGEGQGEESDGGEGDIDKEVRDKLGDSEEWIPGKDGGKEGPGDTGPGKGSKGVSSRGGGRMQATTDVSDIVKSMVPRMNWRRLMEEMVSSSTTEKDYSYKKPHQKTVSGAPIARQAGGMVVKPSERDIEQEINKICIVIDTSGSMGWVIEQVLRECQALLQITQGLNPNSPVGVVFFADDARWFSVNLGQDRFRQVPGAQGLHGEMTEKNSTKGWKKLLGYRSTGGTNFNGMLANQLGALAADGWNIMVFSDSGIITDIPENWALFKQLLKSHPANMFFVADNLHTFRQAVVAIGGVKPRNWSCIDQQQGGR